MILELKDIEKSYRIAGQKKKVLNRLSLAADAGEIISITGKSGCGKTTLLNVIAGITRPSRGSVYINDKKVIHALDLFSSRVRNRDIGFIFQTFRLLSDETVMTNVLLPARIRGSIGRETRDYIDDVLARLKIYKFRKTKAGILSGGQKQRVAIARALTNRPGLILADEPTANLDRKTSIEIFDIISSLKDEGKTVVIITHKDYMHERSDVVYTMENGNLRQER